MLSFLFSLSHLLLGLFLGRLDGLEPALELAVCIIEMNEGEKEREREKQGEKKDRELEREHSNRSSLLEFVSTRIGTAPIRIALSSRFCCSLVLCDFRQQYMEQKNPRSKEKEKTLQRRNFSFLPTLSTTTAAINLEKKLTSCSSSRPFRRPCPRSISPGGHRTRPQRQRQHQGRRFPPWWRGLKRVQ